MSIYLVDLFFFALQTFDFEMDVELDADAAVVEALAEEESDEPASMEAKFVCTSAVIQLLTVSTLIPKNLFHASA